MLVVAVRIRISAMPSVDPTPRLRLPSRKYP
jgi:hypothetical protein